MKTFWRHLEDVLARRLEDVLKTSWSLMAKTSILVLNKTSWRRPLKTKTKDVFKTSSRRLHQNECLLGIEYFSKFFRSFREVKQDDINFSNLFIPLVILEQQLRSTMIEIWPILSMFYTSFQEVHKQIFHTVWGRESWLYHDHRLYWNLDCSRNYLSKTAMNLSDFQLKMLTVKEDYCQYKQEGTDLKRRNSTIQFLH